MNEFVYSESNTFQKLTANITPIYYGTGEIQGVLSADTVCLDAGQKKCVKKMSMLATFTQSGLDGLAADGIVGMSPTKV